MKEGLVVNVLHRLADWVYAAAPRILVVSRAAAKSLCNRGVDPAKVLVAAHWVDISSFEVASARDVRAEYGWDRRFVVMFAGNLGMVQALDAVIECAALLSENKSIHFVFVGDGTDCARLRGLAADRRLDNVQFVGRQPASAMPDFMRAADSLLVHLRPSTVADTAIPTKILSYMAAARPILCAAGGASAELVRDAEAGPIVDAGNPVALADAVAHLASMDCDERKKIGERGYRYLVTNLEKSRVIDFYERTLIEMTRGSRDSPLAAGQRT
jgi:glycosyltransferase involved in cell wall biosynthesis